MNTRRLRRPVAIATSVPLALIGGLVAAQPAPGAPSSTIFINEFHYDNASTDSGELIEVAGPAGTDLTGWTVVLYNGNGGAPYDTDVLGGTISDQQNGWGTVVLTYPSNGIQNGSPDGIALVRPDGTVEQFLSYEGPITGIGGPADGMTSENLPVEQTGSDPAGASLQLTGTGLTYGEFTWSATTANTAGQPNTGQVFDDEDEPPPPSECGDPATFVHQIQGSGLTFDPAFGGEQTVEGVVVDVVGGGMHVQEESADVDANPATSEGIFVFLGGQAAPAVGATVRATGNVVEFGSGGTTMTELTSATFETCATTTEVPPTEVEFPLASAAGLEPVESMLVRLPQDLVISEYFNYDRFGEVVAGVPPNGWDRFFNPTAVVEPGAAAQALLADYATRRITIDDRNSGQNPALLPHPGNGLPFSLENLFRGGDTITGIEGVVEHSFGVYRLQPTTYGSYTEVNPRPTGSPDVGGSIRVASTNVLNYFLTLTSEGEVCGPQQDVDCRGADDANELARQRAKVVANLAALDADVIGLMEMENTPGVEPAADLVAGLNDRFGAGTYDYIDTGLIGTDAIRVGLIYRPAAVRPVGDFAILDSSDDPRFDDTRSRPMLTQTFDVVDTGARFTVSVNHLKSKGSACTGDPDTGDGQGNCNLTRKAAAEAIVDYLAGDPTKSGDPDQLIIGDLNAYDHEDPIDVLVAGGYADQIKRFHGELAYSFVFDGQNGYLDHALANPTLGLQVTGADDSHINADEPDLLDYDTSFKPPEQEALYEPNQFRSADHDPVLVGLALSRAARWRCYAGEEVESYTPGPRADGSPLPPSRSQPANALGFPNGTTVSLGLSGEIVLGFSTAIHNNNGSAVDLRIVDGFDGIPGRQDTAVVSASYDGASWVELGTVRHSGNLDLGPLSAAHFVKVVDVTSGSLRPTTDGYDLDAAKVWTGCV